MNILYDASLKNGKMGIVNKLIEQDKLKDVILKFLPTARWAKRNMHKWTFEVLEATDTHIRFRVEVQYPISCGMEKYEVSDYGFWEIYNGLQIDYSQAWIKFLSARLQGDVRAKYLVGLGEFSKKVATDIENQLLNASQVETVEDIIDLQLEERLIEQQIQKGKTTVIKPEITEEEIEQVQESLTKHDTEHGQLL